MALHVVALSGGKDSTAMALRLAEMEPRDYTYICTPTGDELPEMFEHWRGLAARLGKPLVPVMGGTLAGLVEEQQALHLCRCRKGGSDDWAHIPLARARYVASAARRVAPRVRARAHTKRRRCKHGPFRRHAVPCVPDMSPNVGLKASVEAEPERPYEELWRAGWLG